MWRDYLLIGLLISFFEIRRAGQYRGTELMHFGSVRWNIVRMIQARRDWGHPGPWPHEGRRSTVVTWTRRRAAPVWGTTPDLIWIKIKLSTGWGAGTPPNRFSKRFLCPAQSTFGKCDLQAYVFSIFTLLWHHNVIWESYHFHENILLSMRSCRCRWLNSAISRHSHLTRSHCPNSQNSTAIVSSLVWMVHVILPDEESESKLIFRDALMWIL